MAQLNFHDPVISRETEFCTDPAALVRINFPDDSFYEVNGRT